AWSACTSPRTFNGLSDGGHTVDIRAIDPAGNIDLTPAAYSWTIDATGPAAPVIVSPADPTITSDATPTISGTAEANATVLVYNGATALGSTTASAGGAWSFTPASALADGVYVVTATATDIAANTGPASNTVNITIDTSNPATSLDSTPPADDSSNDPSFSFSANEPGATFECRIDGGAWSVCVSPRAYTDLPDGGHTFEARAIDLAGNVDPTPVSYGWNVDTIPPAAPAINSPVAGVLLTDSTPPVSGTADAGTTVTVYVDGSPAGTATADGSGNWSLIVTPALVDGARVIYAVAEDAAGNDSPPSASVPVTVDATAPTGTVTAQPAPVPPGASPTFDIATPDGTATIACSVNGGSFAPCSSPYTPPALPVGTHTLTVRFTDPAGNTTTETVSFVVSAEPASNPAPPPAPAPVPTPAPPAESCPADEGEVGVPAKIQVTGATVSRKTLLKFNVTSDQFAIVRVTVKSGSKKVGSAARAVNSGKRQVVVKIKKLPAKNGKLTARLSSVSLSGGKGVANAAVVSDAAGKWSVGPLSGKIGEPITSVVECGKEAGAPRMKVKLAAVGKVKIGANKMKVTASSNQFAVSTFMVIQNGKVLSRKVFVLMPGKKLVKPLKFLGSSKLVKGKFTLKASTFSVDGVRLKTTKNLAAK
ncbi:MAG: Ig-like domain-containing protein, partial [Solirubrobacterales bacterium]